MRDIIRKSNFSFVIRGKTSSVRNVREILVQVQTATIESHGSRRAHDRRMQRGHGNGMKRNRQAEGEIERKRGRRARGDGSGGEPPHFRTD